MGRKVSLCVLLTFLITGVAEAASFAGRVVDATTGEPLSRVRIALAGSATVAMTDENGSFRLEGLAPGQHLINVTAVGYGLMTRSVTASDAAEVTLDLALHADGDARRDSVNVSTGPFETAVSNAPTEKTLSKLELQALSMVLLADPLRAMHAMPGVVSNNELRAEFSVRGAGYDRVALFVDGVLTDNFVQAANLGIAGGSASERVTLSTVNSDTLSEASLYSGAFPSTIGDSSAAAVSLTTREGNRVRPGTRIAMGLLGLSGTTDGPLPKERGSWLLAMRTSYADYLQQWIDHLSGANSNDNTAFNFSDLQGKFVYDVSSRHQAGLSLMAGLFNVDEQLTPDAVRLDVYNRLDSRNLLVNAFWRFTPGARTLWTTRVFGTVSRYENTNRNSMPLDTRTRRQTGFRSDFSHFWGGHQLEGGAYVRAISGRKHTAIFGQRQTAQVFESYNEDGVQESGYVQDTWSSEGRRVAATLGLRVEHAGITGEAIALPRAAVTLRPGAWTIRLGAGKYAQFPDFQQLFGYFGTSSLEAERSTHYNLAVERRLGERARVVMEFYDREDRGQLFSLNEPRLIDGRPTLQRNRFANSVDAYARGVELTLQARSSNRVTGWVSYALAKTWYTDRLHDVTFVSDFDQKHTLNVFGTYRLRPTLAFSSQWRYGSGLPVTGFIQEQTMRRHVLSAFRNTARLPYYARLDLRMNKAFVFQRKKLTLAAEVLNVLNRKNVFLVASDAARAQLTGSFSTNLEEGLSVLPSLSVTWEF